MHIIQSFYILEKCSLQELRDITYLTNNIPQNLIILKEDNFNNTSNIFTKIPSYSQEYIKSIKAEYYIDHKFKLYNVIFYPDSVDLYFYYKNERKIVSLNKNKFDSILARNFIGYQYVCKSLEGFQLDNVWAYHDLLFSSTSQQSDNMFLSKKELLCLYYFINDINLYSLIEEIISNNNISETDICVFYKSLILP